MTARTGKTGRKLRCDCKMNQLSPARRAAIFAKSETTSVEELVKVIAAKDGLKISATALGNWLKAERIVRNVNNTADVARQVVSALRAAESGGDIDEAIEALVRERAFDVLASSKDPEEVTMLVKMVNENRKLKLDERKVELMERRTAAENPEPGSGKPLTPEEALANLREMFGWRK